jgi:YVTN family beta-propeller protein
VWVANNGGNTVARIDNPNGAQPHTTNAISLPGSGPFWLAFDGQNMWVTDLTAGAVTRFDPASATVNATVDLGGYTAPWGIATDGVNMWVANSNGNSVSKINARTGAVEDTITLGGSPNSVAYDGSWIWVSQANAGTVSVIDPATSTIVRTISTGSGSYPEGLAFDLTNIWVANNDGNSLMRLRP